MVKKSKGRNAEVTSPRVASKASKLLQGSAGKNVKSVAGSALTQAPNKSTKKR